MVIANMAYNNHRNTFFRLCLDVDLMHNNAPWSGWYCMRTVALRKGFIFEKKTNAQSVISAWNNTLRQACPYSERNDDPQPLLYEYCNPTKRISVLKTRHIRDQHTRCALTTITNGSFATVELTVRSWSVMSSVEVTVITYGSVIPSRYR